MLQTLPVTRNSKTTKNKKNMGDFRFFFGRPLLVGRCFDGFLGFRMVSGYVTIFTLNSHNPCGHPAQSRLFAPFLRVPKKRWKPQKSGKNHQRWMSQCQANRRIFIRTPKLVSKPSELELDFLHHEQSGFRMNDHPYINLTKQVDEALLAFQLGSYGPGIRNQRQIHGEAACHGVSSGVSFWWEFWYGINMAPAIWGMSPNFLERDQKKTFPLLKPTGMFLLGPSFLEST